MSRWEGDCPKCGAAFDRDTRPLTGGTLCPACKDAGRTLVGVIQWSECAPDPRDARIASLEAEVARLEALIVSTVEAAAGIDADLHAEYDRIKAKP